MPEIVTIKLKDSIVEWLLESRVGMHFIVDKSESQSRFGIQPGLLVGFFRELQLKNLITLVDYEGEHAIAGETNTTLDTFWENGGFQMQESIKRLLEDKLLFDVHEMLKKGDLATKKELLGAIKDIGLTLNSAISIFRNVNIFD